MKRVSIFAPMGALDHEPGILNAIRCFAAAGYSVEVLAVRNRYYNEVVFDSPNVRVRFLPWTFNSERESRLLVTLLFTAWIVGAFWRRHSLIFAGGVRALAAAYVYSMLRQTRIVNYQMELYVGGRLRGVGSKAFKTIERRAARRSAITIEHNVDRKDILAADLGIAAENVTIVPNAPLGPARHHRSDYISKRLRLDSSTRILLCPGTLNEAFESSMLVRAAQSMPDGWQCVLHSIQQRSEEDPYIHGLRKLDRGSRVKFSLEPVPYSKIDEVMGSARIGVALYSSAFGENYSTIGHASGKLCHFLKLGVPVVVSPLPGLGDFVVERGIGEVLYDPAALGDVIARIEADYDRYCDRALRCFDSDLSYERHFGKVIELTDKWVAEPRRGAKS